MTGQSDSAEKAHYICQTYVQKLGKSGAPQGLKVDKQYPYSTADEAERRAEREFRAEGCIGADAYVVVEDAASGEVGAPTFLVRLGEYPEFDEF